MSPSAFVVSGRRLRELVAESMAAIRDLEDVVDLLDTKPALEAQIQDLRQQAQALDDEVGRRRAAAVALQRTIDTLEARIQVLGQQQRGLEARPQEIREQMAAERAAWDDEKRRDRQAHDQVMRRLAGEREQAGAALLELQEQLRAVHASVGTLMK